jgi:hypothetical protein
LNSRQVSVATSAQHISELFGASPKSLFASANDRLLERVPGLDPNAALTRRGFPADKWLLSSATQKLMRRGLAEQAVKTALALHALDPEYLPRRLPIIAFEDIGLGNVVACFDTLHVFRTQRFASATPEQQRRQILANLVRRLAGSLKSRTGCDIFCLAHADQNVSTAAAKFARSSEQCLVALASDRSAEVASRALALHLLSGMSVREGRWPRTLSRFNAVALKAVARKLHLPPVIAWMMIEGRNTAGLAAMLPLVMEAVAGTDPHTELLDAGEAKAFAEKVVVGVPACAADQYTRVGKGAIAEFTKAIRDKHLRFFENVLDARSHSKLVSMAIFHVEGSKLDQWLETKATAEYRQRIERIELQTLGLPDPELHIELYRILEVEFELLWQIRQSHLRAAYGRGRRVE